MSKIKNERVNQEFKRCLSEIINNEIGDDRVKGRCTVVSVEVTNDLAYAKVFVSVMGDERAKEKALDSLKSAKGFLKKRLSQTVLVRKIPELTFLLDTSLDYSIKINQLIDSVSVKEENKEENNE